VQIEDVVLESDEYEIDYLKSDPTLDVEISQGVVIAFDAQLTPELIKEGYVRDLVRQIQEARKEAGYDIADRIQIAFAKDPLDLLSAYQEYIQEETLSTKIDSLDEFDLEQELELGDTKYVFMLKR
jgi:isoleucyl-tRNA synthetase